MLDKGEKSILWLCAFGLITIVLWQIPGGMLILYPFTLLGTWFHEMAHGLAAVILGGNFVELEIYSNGSGVAHYYGPLALGNIGYAIVAAAGPIGPTIAGSIFLVMSVNKNATKFALYFLFFALIVSVILWVRSYVGFAVILVFGIVTFLIAARAQRKIMRRTLQFLAIQAFMSVYLSIGYLFSTGGTINGQQFVSDTAHIEENLWLPYWVWGLLIIAFSVMMFYYSIIYVYKGNKKE